MRMGASTGGRLLDAFFVGFWRQHGEVLQGAAPYQEVAPHLVLMAFLARVVNGGGSVEREYAIGRGRMDLRVTYRGETLAMKIKTWRTGDREPLEGGAGADRVPGGHRAGDGLAGDLRSAEGTGLAREANEGGGGDDTAGVGSRWCGGEGKGMEPRPEDIHSRQRLWTFPG